MQRTTIASAAGAVLLLVLAPAAALAESHEAPAAAAESPRKPWDQERMTELSGELATAMRRIRRSFRKDPNFRNEQTPNQRATHNMEQTLRGLEQSTRQLHNRVSGGAGFEETRNIARNIGMLLNDADMWSRRIMTSAWVDDQIQPAMRLVNEIAPYYGSGPLFDPETMQRLDRAPDPQARQPAAE